MREPYGNCPAVFTTLIFTQESDKPKLLVEDVLYYATLWIARNTSVYNYQQDEYRAGSISPLPISIRYRYFWPKISAISISISLTAAHFGLLIYTVSPNSVPSLTGHNFNTHSPIFITFTVARCLSVRPSVRPSVCLSHAVSCINSYTLSSKFFYRRVSPSF